MNYLFDICDTLYYSNTTFDFISFFLKRENPSNLEKFNRISKRKTAIFILRYSILKLFKLDLFRIKAVTFLKGYSKEKLSDGVSAFYNEYLVKKEIGQTMNILKNNLNKTILVSSSLDIIVNEIAKNLKVKKFFSSELEFENEICNGRLKLDITGKKYKYFKNANYIVYTDNYSDYSLVKNATIKNVIVHKYTAKLFWKKLAPNFIELYK